MERAGGVEARRAHTQGRQAGSRGATACAGRDAAPTHVRMHVRQDRNRALAGANTGCGKHKCGSLLATRHRRSSPSSLAPPPRPARPSQPSLDSPVASLHDALGRPLDQQAVAGLGPARPAHQHAHGLAVAVKLEHCLDGRAPAVRLWHGAQQGYAPPAHRSLLSRRQAGVACLACELRAWHVALRMRCSRRALFWCSSSTHCNIQASTHTPSLAGWMPPPPRFCHLPCPPSSPPAALAPGPTSVNPGGPCNLGTPALTSDTGMGCSSGVLVRRRLASAVSPREAGRPSCTNARTHGANDP